MNSGDQHDLIKRIILAPFSKSSFPISPVKSATSCMSSLFCFPFLFVYSISALSFSPPTCGFALHPSVRPLLHCHPSLTYGFPLQVCVCLVLPRVQWGSPLICMCVLQTTIERWRVCVCTSAGLWAWLWGVQQLMQHVPNDPQMRHFTLLVSRSFVLRSSKYAAAARHLAPARSCVWGTAGEVGCAFSQVTDVCLLAVAGPFFAMGLVDLPGRLRQAYMQVPESQPSHRLGPSGQVSAFTLVNPNLSRINKSSCCWCCSREKCNLSQPASPDCNAVRERGGVNSRVAMGFEPRLPALQSAWLTTQLACGDWGGEALLFITTKTAIHFLMALSIQSHLLF